MIFTVEHKTNQIVLKSTNDFRYHLSPEEAIRLARMLLWHTWATIKDENERIISELAPVSKLFEDVAEQAKNARDTLDRFTEIVGEEKKESMESKR